jgi:hypothetical protein
MNRIPTWFLGLLVVALILGVASVATADEAKGKIKSAEAGKVVITDAGGKDLTFTTADKVKISVGGKEAKVTDLKKDAEVTVKYKKEGDKMIAEEITAK